MGRVSRVRAELIARGLRPAVILGGDLNSPPDGPVRYLAGELIGPDSDLWSNVETFQWWVALSLSLSLCVCVCALFWGGDGVCVCAAGVPWPKLALALAPVFKTAESIEKMHGFLAVRLFSIYSGIVIATVMTINRQSIGVCVSFLYHYCVVLLIARFCDIKSSKIVCVCVCVLSNV